MPEFSAQAPATADDGGDDRIGAQRADSVLAHSPALARPVLGGMLYTTLVGMVLTLLNMHVQGTAWPQRAVVCGVLLGLLLLLWLYRAGRLWAAACGFTLLLLTCGLAGGLAYGSIRGVGTMALVGAIVAGGALLGTTALALTVAAAVASVIALAWAQAHALLPAANFEVGFGSAFQFTAALVAIGLIVGFARSMLVRAVRQAREGEQRLAMIVRSSPAALVVARLSDGRIEDINPAYERIFGIARREALGRSTVELGLWSAEERAVALQGLEPGRRLLDRPVLLRRRNGEPFEAELSAELTMSQGEPVVVASIHDVSQQHRAAQQQRESEARLQAVFDASPVALVVQDLPARRVLMANAAAEAMFRMPARDRLGQRPPDEIWLDAEALAAFRRELAAHGRCAARQVRLQRADGERFEALVAASTFDTAQGRQSTLAVLDLSVETALREAQRSSDERFAKAFAASPICMAITRLSDGVFLEVNEAVRPNFGYAREEMLGRTAGDIGLWPEPSDRERMLQALRERGRLMGWEGRVRHRDGPIVDCRIYADQIEIAGEPCMLAFTINVTEARREEAQLAEAAAGVSAATGEDFFRRLVEHLSRATGAERVNIGELVDGGRRVRTVARFVDGRVAKGLEYELAGTPCEQVLQEGQLKIWQDEVGESFPADEPLVRAGLKAYIGAPLLGADGQPAGIMNALSAQPLSGSPRVLDVFRIFAARAQAELVRVQREREIRALNESLELRVRERTAEVEAANRELEAFSYSVSHDLRAPLRAIDGFSQLLTTRHAQALPPDAREHLRLLRASAQRMERLIDDLLTLARANRGALKPAQVDLSLLARGVVAELSRLHPQRSVQWQLEPALVVHGDAGLLHILLMNLMGNALKYTSKVEAAQISLQRLGTAQGLAEFVLRDNGAGFDPARAAELFQPFRRLHADREFEGTGIGLTTVQRIVERHGGTVRGEGRVGAGASFYFTLPAG